MQYSFNDIFSDDMYRNTRVLFIFGKYNFFNKLVSDTFKYKNLNTEENSLIKFDDDISREFGFTDDEEDEDSTDRLSHIP